MCFTDMRLCVFVCLEYLCVCVSVCAALKELNRYYKHCLSVCKQLHQNDDFMLNSMDAVVQSAAVTADKLLYSYAIELVGSFIQ